MKTQHHEAFKQTLRAGVWMISLFAFLIVSGSSPAVAQTREEAAIKKVLKDSPTTFFKRDAAAWQATWKHAPEVSSSRMNSGFYNTAMGWDKISEGVLKTLKDNPQPIPIEIVQENHIIRVDTKLATAEFDQTLSNFPDEPDTKFKTRQYVVLQKENNQWKLVSQVSTNPESYVDTDVNVEARMNATGYSLLFAKKLDEAIDVLMLNVKLFPNAWNTYDSLGEAYALKGNKEMAIKNYEKSMELNPKNDNGKLALVKLKE